jgi:hypothetical protein
MIIIHHPEEWDSPSVIQDVERFIAQGKAHRVPFMDVLYGGGTYRNI